jgi:hypothetical protein
MASVRRMPELPRQGMDCGCAARPRSLEGAGISFLSNLRRKRTGIPVKNFRRQPCRDAVERANDKIRPARPKEYLDHPEGEDRDPQSVERHVGQKSGESGFRVWFDDPHPNYVECSCGWRPDLGPHYQVRAHYEPRE